MPRRYCSSNWVVRLVTFLGMCFGLTSQAAVSLAILVQTSGTGAFALINGFGGVAMKAYWLFTEFGNVGPLLACVFVLGAGLLWWIVLSLQFEASTLSKNGDQRPKTPEP